MYHKFLDRFDERRAELGNAVKKIEPFELDSGLAFSIQKEDIGLKEFCKLSIEAASNSSFFDSKMDDLSEFERTPSGVKFPSSLTTDVVDNNTVHATITESGSLEKALVVFHHWNAVKKNASLAKFLSKRGITVVEISMPYHFERSRPNSGHADYILSSNVGRTLQSMKQAVIDGKKLVSWLKAEGYGEVSVLGLSLGSWVGGLVAAHDENVSKASLFLTGDSLADMVWSGVATQKIRESFGDEIDLASLRDIWSPLDLGNYAAKFSRANFDLQIISAKRDKVVLPELSKRLIDRLHDAGSNPEVLQFNCGHYSLGKPPFIISAGMNLKRFLLNTKN